MKKPFNNWDRMLQTLLKVKERQGHCDVPANYDPDPALGRWVAVQRHRRKGKRLTADQIAKLDKAGFIWSPGEKSWDQSFNRLADFKARYGHCDVPAQCDTHPNLGSWVANQRHRKKTGKLSAARIKKLEQLGFRWFIYGMGGEKRKNKPRPEAAPARKRTSEPDAESRIFNLGHDEFVQYNGHGAMPRELDNYLKRHGGEYPPFIPLPSEPARFVMFSDGFGRERLIKWAGHGRLNEEVLDYVRENGCLPPRK